MLHDELQSLVLSNAPGDAWSFIWNNSAYSSQRFYGLNFIGLSPPIPFVWNWKTKCINKIKVFMWLLFCDLLNTRDMQDRRNCAQEDANLTCALCALGVRETREHLFFTCPFSDECWRKIGFTWNSNLEFFSDVGFGKIMLQRKRLSGNFFYCMLAYLEAEECFNISGCQSSSF